MNKQTAVEAYGKKRVAELEENCEKVGTKVADYVKFHNADRKYNALFWIVLILYLVAGLVIGYKVGYATATKEVFFSVVNKEALLTAFGL